MECNRYWGVNKHQNPCIALLWLCCCCGFVPIVASIKSLIMVIPISVLIIAGTTIITLRFWPIMVFQTFYTNFKTKLIGINLKVIITLLLPFVLILYPLFFIFASIPVGIVVGIFAPIMYTFLLEYNIWTGGTIDFLKKVWNYYIKWSWEIHLDYLSDFKDYRNRNPIGAPYDIYILYAIIALFFGLIGMIVVGTFITILSFLKLIPAIVKCFYEVVRYAFRFVAESISDANIFLIMLSAIFFPFVLLFLVILPFLVFIACIAISIGGFCYGLYATKVFYTELKVKRNIKNALHETYRFIAGTIYDFDELTNEFIFSVKRSLFCCKDPNTSYHF